MKMNVSILFLSIQNSRTDSEVFIWIIYNMWSIYYATQTITVVSFQSWNAWILYVLAGILTKAKGLAILTVVKIGFLVTARAGSGIVIAKLGNRS